MRTERNLHERLIDLAAEVRVPAAPDVMIRRRVSAVRRRRAALATSALLIMAVVAMPVILATVAAPSQRELPVVQADGPLLSWERAGEAPEALVDDAVRAWDQATGTGGSAIVQSTVRALLATEHPTLGSVVVLQSSDNAGRARIGFFATASTSRMWMLADRPAPDPRQTRVISLVSPHRPSRSADVDYWSGYVIAVATPGVTHLRITSTTVDDDIGGGKGPATGRFIIRALPRTSTALNVRIEGFVGNASVFDAPAQGGALGDADALPATVLSRSEDTMTVSVTDPGRVRAGQLVAVADGLVGRVLQVDPASRQVQVQLPNASGFTLAAYTDISNQHGVLRGTDDGLLFENLDPNAAVNEGNRILVADPSQAGNLAGAITAARPTQTRTSAQSAVAARSTVSVDDLREVYISVPAAIR